MAISKTSICNIALTHLGERSINTVDDDNQRARLCKLRFEDVLKIDLTSHAWTCVVKRHDCQKSTSNPVWGFDNMFNLPTDFLRLLQLQEVTQPYRIEVSTEGNMVILTNSSTAKIRYIHNVFDNLTLLSHEVANLVGIRLASEIAEPLTSKTKLKNSLFERYMVELAQARSLDSMQGTPEIIDNYSWLNVRNEGSQAQVTFDIPMTDSSGNNPSPNWNVP